eukprot:TRINITY_DN4296_c1_g1_i1.p1 TRINITY_DN4296_c1_g1~~TRINITY_DN4296_c1_g1_i1.p1  ORF type:complete len:273 (-),score=76.23 TRINITY_DN4296_c1_g1_i1:136-954(-)
MIGKYILGQQIGKGIDSNCYIVQKEEGSIYCMKVVALFHSENAKRDRIEKEIEILKALGNNHQNIINYEDSFKIENAYINKVCLVTEVMEMDLFKYIKSKNGKLNLRESKKIAYQMLDGMNFCHSNFVCHHDIKLENLTIDTNTGKIKIIDFGMSTISSNEEEVCNMYDSKGTPLYVSPEKFSKIKYDGRKADIWSCGILMYRMITGSFPFGTNCKDLRSLALSVINDEFKILPKFSVKLIDFFQKILCKNQLDRYTAFQCMDHPYFSSIKN